MTARVLILGAGFGGLELGTRLSEALGDTVDVTLIDWSDTFVFGFSKPDVMFGGASLDQVRLPYRRFMKPGVRFLRQTVTSIDPERRRVTTDAGVFDADYLVVALGAALDTTATPGLAERGNEFYTVAGAARLAEVLPEFTRGHAIVGACGAPYKCPPRRARQRCSHDYLTRRGVRAQCDITLVLPFPAPVPPSPETSAALVKAFAARNITYVPNRRVVALEAPDPTEALGSTVMLDDGTALPCDLFLGIPKHCVPAAVEASGLAENGWIPVNPRTLETKFSGVYAIGDVADTGTPKAGVFAEGGARAVASSLIARLGGAGQTEPFAGVGLCHVEFGDGQVGRVDVDFFSGPKPTGAFQQATADLRAEKQHFGISRRTRWFGK